MGGLDHRGHVEILGGEVARRHRLAEVLDESVQLTPLVGGRLLAGQHPLEGVVGGVRIVPHLIWRNVGGAHKVTAPRRISRRIAASPRAWSIFTAPGLRPTTATTWSIERPPMIRRSSTSR